MSVVNTRGLPPCLINLPDGYPEINDNCAKEIRKKIIYSEGANTKWARIILEWNEKITEGDRKDQRKNHRYAAVFNTESGDVYFDCRPRKIFYKFCSALLIRPVFTVGKTLYHLFLPLSIPLEIYNAVSEGNENGKSCKEIAQDFLINIGKNFVDIVATPLFGTVLTIIFLSGVVLGLLIGPFKPTLLYDIREAGIKVEILQNWGASYTYGGKKTLPTKINPCFYPILNFVTCAGVRWAEEEKWVDKESFGNNDHLRCLNIIICRKIQYCRNHWNPFNNYGRKLGQDETYVSKALQEWEAR